MRVPRFYFHTENGKAHRDKDGVELPAAAAAEAEALRLLGELLKDGQQDFQHDGGLRLTVEDARGLTLLTIDVSLTRGAASAPPRPKDPA